MSEQGATELVDARLRLNGENVYLTQVHMGQLAGYKRSVITKYIRRVFDEGGLNEGNSVPNIHLAFSDKPVEFDSLTSSSRRATGSSPYGTYTLAGGHMRAVRANLQR